MSRIRDIFVCAKFTPPFSPETSSPKGGNGPLYDKGVTNFQIAFYT